MILKISIRNISIAILIKLPKHLKDLDWTSKHFVFYCAKDLLNSAVVDILICDAFSYYFLVNLYWGWIASDTMV